MTRICVFVAAVLVPIASASVARGQSGMAQNIRGTVFDSVTARYLTNATVQFVRLDSQMGRAFTSRTDDSGRFDIQVPPGRFIVGFTHVALDSIGLEIPPRELTIADSDTGVNLATPAPATIIRRLCEGATDTTTTGILLGHIYGARTVDFRDSARITVGWVELNMRGASVASEERRIETRSTGDGWFGICNVPHGLPVFVRAEREAETSGTIVVELVPREVRHLSLLIDHSERIESDSAARSGGTPYWVRGAFVLQGEVIDPAGSPVAGASVAIVEAGREGKSNLAGEFRLDSLPGGSWLLNVRKVGFEPIQLPVALYAQSVAQRITLSRTATVLSTVGVTAPARELRLSGFRSRMSDARKGILRGHFVTPAEIEKRGSTLVTNLLEGMSGVRVSKHPNSPDFRKRVVYGANMCRMTVYLDEIRILPKLDGKAQDEINELVSSTDLAGIEVYPSMGGAPAKYQTLNGTCGVVLLWSR